MTFFQAFWLAIIQGLTEFLPVSSSGHLVIFQKLFGLYPPVLFDILVHVGTLGAILVYFRRELTKISRRTFGLLALGTLPAALVGLFLQSWLAVIFDSARLVGFALLITSGLLFSTKLIKKPKKNLTGFQPSDAFIVGLFQALAILPGVSRSGATIVAGLHRRANRQTAFRFSFFLAIPAILGALVLQLPALANAPAVYLGQGILGMFIAGLVGFSTLKLLEKILLSARLWIFGFYCLLVGVTILLL